MARETVKKKLIEQIEDAMMQHVQRAILAHIRKHGSYIIDCVGADPNSHTYRSFMALDDELMERFSIKIVGVIHTGTAIDLLILPINQLRREQPIDVRYGYWRLHITGRNAANGRVWYANTEPISDWERISFSALDKNLRTEKLRILKENMDMMIAKAELLDK